MRVLVCRPREDAEETARKLARLGHEALVAPVLEIVALPLEALPPRIDAVVLTSRHAVASLAEGAEFLHRPVFAVGRATAAAARARGFKDVRIGAGDAASLPDLIRLTLRAPARLLYLAGSERKSGLEETLQRHGYALDLREAYAARPAPPWAAAVTRALAEGRLQACVHFSRRSAALALQAALEGGVEGPFRGLLHGCLSADVATPLVEAGASVVVAPRPEEVALLWALPHTSA